NPFLAVQDIEFNFTYPGWSPFSAGIAVGIAQVASVVLVKEVIGASSVFPYVGYLAVKIVDRNWRVNAPFYEQFEGRGTTVRFSIGVIGGGLVSALTSGLVYGAGIAAQPVTNILAFSPGVVVRLIVGGALLVYGSRIASGCPSGHGLSGMAQLSIASGVTVAAMFGGGTLMAYIVEKAKVYLPSVIIGQMKWSQLSMLIVFLTATITGLLAVSILEKCGIYERSAKSPLSFLGGNWFRGYGNNILGGLFIGFGMSLSGACPGTVLVQIGVGVPTTPYTLLGALFGSVSYGYLHRIITSRIPKFGAKNPIATLDSSRVSSVLIAIVASVVGFPLLWYGTTRIPWRFDFYQDMVHDFLHSRAEGSLDNPFSSIHDFGMDFTHPAWSPFIGGLAIGASQIVSILLTGSVIGASSVYPYLGSVIVTRLDKKWEQRAPYYKDYTSLSSSIRFSVGMVLGSLVSALTSGMVYAAGIAAKPVSDSLIYSAGNIARLIIGGVFLVYGSRIAGGCTSGHGLSGIAQLSLASFVTVAAMFGGGTLMAFIVDFI
ncbi:UNVERIFIED_CONTAM: hypothetical protein HDU68_005853, partial [Siphonaria sp. JEL0065]